jgi:pimeloyl-ACP methyl ester carboxylesterase
MPYFSYQEQPLFYTTQGRGPAVVFLHGLGADHTQALAALSGLKNYQLISLDMPGHGKSPRANTRSSFDYFSNVLLNLLDHLNIDCAVLGGISMGAGVSVRVAQQSPSRVAGLLLVRPAWFDHGSPDNLTIVAQLGQWIETLGVERAEALLCKEPVYHEALTQNPNCAKSIAGVLHRAKAIENAAVLYEMVQDQPIDQLTDIADLSVPTLIVINNGDPLHPVAIAKAWAQTLSGAQHQTIASRYLSAKQHYKELVSVIQQFMDGRVSDAAFSPSTQELI